MTRSPSPREASGPSGLIALTGATGYLGGRLLRILEGEGATIRCLTRRPEALVPRVAARTEVVEADLLSSPSLSGTLEGVETAYYLVHSMGSAQDFMETDRRAARNFARAAREAGVGRIVYLGGLGSETQLSPHLASRQEVGEILRDSSVPTVELRASIVLGSGSLSFELIRALTEKLPVMVTPRWVRRLAQPIAVEDVLAYLEAARHGSVPEGVYEIGGPDRVSYLDLMAEYARARGLRRVFIPVPVLSPRLSSLWLGLVTPVYARVGRKLVESLRNDTVVTDDRAPAAFPGIRPMGVRDAISRALVREDRAFAETRWCDALSSGGEPPGDAASPFGPRRADSRSVQVSVPPAEAFRPVRRIGGRNGWYYADWIWRARGFLDLLAGGVGLRRGRRDPERVLPGEPLDFWRVEAYEEPTLLRLRAEMRLPGRAWLQYEVRPLGEDRSEIRQTALFDPRGALGLAYWYALKPVHALIFRRMLAGIAAVAERHPTPESAGDATGRPRGTGGTPLRGGDRDSGRSHAGRAR